MSARLEWFGAAIGRLYVSTRAKYKGASESGTSSWGLTTSELARRARRVKCSSSSVENEFPLFGMGMRVLQVKRYKEATRRLQGQATRLKATR